MISTDRQATSLAIFAVLVWSFVALFTANVKRLPVFEIIAIMFSFSCLLSIVIISKRRRWHLIKEQPLSLWLYGMLGLGVYKVCYFLGFKFAPPAHVAMFNYLWPIMIFFFAKMILGHHIESRHYWAAFLGFCGVAVLLSSEIYDLHFHWRYLLGYGLGFIGAIIWALYTITLVHFNRAPVEVTGIFCGMAAFLALICHYELEVTLVPTMSEWMYLLLLGLITSGVAYYFWAYGLMHGNYKVIAIFSYVKPVLSTCVLILFHQSAYTHSVIVASVLICLAGMTTIQRGALT